MTQGKWSGYYSYAISRDNDGYGDGTLSGYIKQDTFVIAAPGGRWPHYIECNCCEVFSYFVRE